MSRPGPLATALWRLFAVIFLGLPILMGIDFACGIARGRQFHESYSSLRIGMTAEDVERLFGRVASHTCRYESFVIRYYDRPSSFILDGPFKPMTHQLPDRVDDLSRLPDLYAAAQLAFESNRLVAFAWNGEGTEVMTVEGTTPGQHLDVLDARLLPRRP